MATKYLPSWAKSANKGQLEFGARFAGKAVSRISKRALKLRFKVKVKDIPKRYR